MIRARGAWPAVVSLLLLAACERAPEISDTGYVGSWSHGTHITSTISIDREGDDYRFWLYLRSDDGTREVRCAEAGRCSEYRNGERTLDYRFDIRPDPQSGHLMLSYDVVNRIDDTAPPERIVDELVLLDDNLTIRAFTVEKNGRTFERGQGSARSFRKVSNEVMVAPAADAPRGGAP